MKDKKISLISAVGLLIFTNLLTFLIFEGKVSVLSNALAKEELASIDGLKISADDAYSNWTSSISSSTALNVILEDVDYYILNDLYKDDEEAQKEVEKEISEQKKYFESQSPDKDLETQLKDAGMTVDEWEKSVEVSTLKKYGATNYIKENVVTKEEVEAKLADDVPKYETSHILIKTGVANSEGVIPSEEEVKAKADEIYSELTTALEGKTDVEAKKATFAEFAKKYSQDEDTKDNGGNIGYSNSETTYYDAEASKLSVGDISAGAIKTPYGYSIILKTGQEDKKDINDKEVYEKYALEVAAEILETTATYTEAAMIQYRDDYNFKIVDEGIATQYEKSKESNATAIEASKTTEEAATN